MTSSPYVPSLVCTREAARILGLSAATLERHRWAGTGPAYVRAGGLGGRAIRYRICDLVAWIERHLVTREGERL
jgi:predicted DNA-binding transcriptional regulator AlpA